MRKFAAGLVFAALLLAFGVTAAEDAEQPSRQPTEESFKLKFPNAIFLIPEERITDWEYKPIGVLAASEGLNQNFPLREALNSLERYGKNAHTDAIVDISIITVPGYVIVYGTAVAFKDKNLLYTMWTLAPDGKAEKEMGVPLRYEHSRKFDEVEPLDNPRLSTIPLERRYYAPTVITVPPTPKRKRRGDKFTLEMNVRTILDEMTRVARDLSFDAVVGIRLIYVPRQQLYAYGTAVRFAEERKDELTEETEEPEKKMVRPFLASTIGLQVPYTTIKIVSVTLSTDDHPMDALKLLSEQALKHGAGGLTNVKLNVISGRIFAHGAAVSFRDVSRMKKKGPTALPKKE